MVFISCKHASTPSNEVPLVKVYNDYLYLSDVKGMLSTTFSAADSERVVKHFIDSWIKNKECIDGYAIAYLYITTKHAAQRNKYLNE